MIRRVPENEDHFDFNMNKYLGSILPDRPDANRRKLGGAGQKQPSVRTSATGHGLHLSARATGLKGAKSGKSSEDEAERGEGSMHHPVSIQQETLAFVNRVIHHGWVGFKDIHDVLIGDGQMFSGIHGGVFVAKIRYYSICFSVCHAPRTPSNWLGGSVRGLFLLSYTLTHIANCGFMGKVLVDFFPFFCCVLLCWVGRPRPASSSIVSNKTPCRRYIRALRWSTRACTCLCEAAVTSRTEPACCGCFYVYASTFELLHHSRVEPRHQNSVPGPQQLCSWGRPGFVPGKPRDFECRVPVTPGTAGSRNPGHPNTTWHFRQRHTCAVLSS